MSTVAEALLGRDLESAMLADLLSGAREGRSAALVLRGEPGIGKSALLELGAALADGFQVLRAQGIEAESEIAFAGLQELVRPVVGLLDRLPERQRAVLSGALALAPPVQSDPLAVRAATLSLLGAAADAGPVLVVVDDAHWLDAPSAEALAFASRRLDREGIVVLFAVRDAEPASFDPTGLREMTVGPLSEQASRELIVTRRAGSIASEVVEQLSAVAAGNPLVLLELPEALSPSQLSGHEPLPEPVPVGSGAERAFASRLAHLPGDAREALVIAAATERDDQAAMMAALHARGLGDAAFAPAERVGLITIAHGRFAFRHPVVRSVVYQSATGDQRRAAHAALAAVPDLTADHRAWHRAAAAVGPDEGVATALENAAAQAAARGGLPTAARTYQRAAAFSTNRGARAARLLSAATCALASGRLAWAAELVQEGLPLSESPIGRADLEHIAAAVERERGSVTRAREMLWEGAAGVAPEDPGRAAMMMVDATAVDTMSGNLIAAAESGRRARELAASGSCSLAVRGMVRVTNDWVANRRGRLPAREIEMDAARMIVGSTPGLPPTAVVAIELLWAGWYAQQVEVTGVRADNALDRAIAQARERGSLAILPYLLGQGAQLDFREGRWPRAAARAAEAAELAGGTGQPGQRAWGLVNLAWIEAALGQDTDCRAHVDEVNELSITAGTAALSLQAAAVLGLLELGLGDIPAAVTQLERCAQAADAAGHNHPNVLQYEADYVEALHAAGRDQDARVVAERLARAAEQVQSCFGRATAVRCRGLLASEAEFEARFEEALALHESVPSAFARARTQLCYGERLRRARRKRDARQPLSAAMAAFENLGAAPWTERARRELAATGATVRSHADPKMRAKLTPQELRVALIIADGATISEAASQLFLSPKTVDAHLGRAYRKLSVHNRAQLATTLIRRGGTVV